MKSISLHLVDRQLPSHPLKSHSGELLALRKLNLMPHVPKVKTVLLGTILDGSLHRRGECVDVANCLLTDESDAPLKHIDGDARARAQVVQVRPALRERRNIEFGNGRSGNVRQVGDVVLLEDRESRAGVSSRPKEREQAQRLMSLGCEEERVCRERSTDRLAAG